MEARDMLIEFERRVTLIDPSLKTDKLTSSVIFSFLNAYAERYVKLCYTNEDNMTDGSRVIRKNTEAIKNFIVETNIPVTTTESNKNMVRIALPDDYSLYIRSTSRLSKNYKLESEITNASNYVMAPNTLIRDDQATSVLPAYYDKSVILSPCVVLNAGDKDETLNKVYLNVIHDQYTIIKSIDLTYLRRPKKFDVIDVDNVNVLNYCELPEDVHMEIVEGAVEMFVTEAKYRLNTKQNDEKR